MVTHRGIAVAVATVGAYVAGALLHYPELGVLSAGGVLALAVGVAWIVKRPRLSISRTIEPARVTRGEVALGLLEVANPGSLAVSPTVAEDACGPRTVAVAIPRLAPGASTAATYRLPTTRRGVLDVGPLVVVRQDPFGCWRTAQRLGTSARLWVRPVVHPLSTLPVGSTRSLDGPDRDGLPHGSITFHALRGYVPGDDLRHIHWRSSARTGALMVKEHVDTSLPTVTLLLDTTLGTHSSESFEEAVEVAASLVAAVTAARLPLRLLTTGEGAVRGRGTGGDGQEMLDLLAGVALREDCSLAELATHLATERRGDVLLVVTGHAPPEDVRAIGALASRFHRGILALVSPQAETVEAPVPAHVRLVRVERATDFPQQWERVAAR